MLCCVQGGETALYWAALRGYSNIVQTLVDHGAAVDLGRDKVTIKFYLTCGWSLGCGFIVFHASTMSKHSCMYVHYIPCLVHTIS